MKIELVESVGGHTPPGRKLCLGGCLPKETNTDINALGGKMVSLVSGPFNPSTPLGRLIASRQRFHV